MVPLCASNPPPTCSSPFHRFAPAGRGGAGYTVPGGRLTYSMMACFGSCVVMVELSFGSSHAGLVLPAYIAIAFSHILPYGLHVHFRSIGLEMRYRYELPFCTVLCSGKLSDPHGTYNG